MRQLKEKPLHFLMGVFTVFGSNTVVSGRGDQYAGGASMFYLKW